VIVVGRSPMTQTLADLAAALGWRPTVVDAAEFADTPVDPRAVVIVATQGHGDEEAVEHAVSARPAFVGLVASRKRGEAVVGYLADRGVATSDLERVHYPVGLDLGPTSHREIAVSVLAEIVQLRAAGKLLPVSDDALDADVDRARPAAAQAIDPVCAMTVAADRSSHPVDLDGATYYFCSVGCRDAFVRDPGPFVTGHASKEA
jgi:xanthine dehydrogenase accessory factor